MQNSLVSAILAEKAVKRIEHPIFVKNFSESLFFKLNLRLIFFGIDKILYVWRHNRDMVMVRLIHKNRTD
jgi:hypothetical protein